LNSGSSHSNRRGYHYHCRLSLLIIVLLSAIVFPSLGLAQTIQVALPQSASADSGSIVRLPVTVSDLTNRNVLAFFATVSFDDQVLRVTGVATDSTLSSPFDPLNVQIETSRILISGSGASPLNGSGVLLNLVFDVIGRPGQISNLKFDFFLFNTGDPPAALSDGQFRVNKAEEPNITVEPRSHNFGPVIIDSTAEKRFRLANGGAGPLMLQFVTVTGPNAANFETTGLNPALILAPGDSQLFFVRFTPDSAGIRTATLEIRSNDPDQPVFSVSLSGSGVAVVPEISLLPGSLDFGFVTLGEVAVDSLLVVNSGDADLEVSNMSLVGANPTDFAGRVNPTPFVIAAGETQKLLVGFQPQATGQRSARLQISSNDPGQPLVEAVLSGFGMAVQRPDITLSSDSLNFGEVVVDSLVSRILTVSNVGPVALEVTMTELSGPDSGQFHLMGGGAFSVQPADSHNIFVTFSPNSDGPRSATLQIRSNDPDENTIDVPLTGLGKKAPAPSLVVVPDSVTFGNVLLDSTMTQSLSIKNSGTASLRIATIGLTAGSSQDFALIGTAPIEIAPADSQVVQIIFTPGVVGPAFAKIEISSNDPDRPLTLISLQGTGVTAPQAVVLVSPDSIAFGVVPVGTDSQKTVLVFNSGDAILQVSKISLTGSDRNQFFLSNSVTPFGLAPGDSQSIAVRFSPQIGGSFQAALLLLTNDPQRDTVEVALTGTGASPLRFSVTIASPADSSSLCGDSTAVRLVATLSGGISPRVDSCGVNGQIAAADRYGFLAHIALLSGPNLIAASCAASDSLGQMAMARDSITIFVADAPVCTTRIISPQPNQLISSDSIRVFVSHSIAKGSPPFSVMCEVNGIQARRQDSLFVATIPCGEGRLKIVATATVVDSCGKKSECSTTIEVECRLRDEPSILLGLDEDSRSLVRVDVNAIEPVAVKLGHIVFDGDRVKEMEAMAFDPITRKFLIVSNKKGGKLFALDPAQIPSPSSPGDIEVELIGILGSTHIDGIAIHPETGEMFGVDTEREVLLRIDRSTAETTSVGPLGFGNVEGLAFTKTAKPVLFGIDNDTKRLITIDTETGKGQTVSGEKVGFRNVECLEFSPDGTLFGFSDHRPERFITIDAESGIGQEFVTMGSNGLDIEGLSFFLADPTVLFTTDIENAVRTLPENFTLSQNYPNPFNPSTRINFDIPASARVGSRVQLQIYNILGKLVRTVLNEARPPGHYTVEWSGNDDAGLSVPSGLYVYRLRTTTFSQARTMILLK